MKTGKTHYTIKVSCPATSGIVAAVTGFLAEHGGYITEMAQFDEQTQETFFMRAVFRFNDDVKVDMAAFKAGFEAISARFSMQWELHDQSVPMRVLIMVSKYDHCLTDLLYRYKKGELDMQITAIVSNHLDLRAMAEREGIRFIYLPVTPQNKAEQEAELISIIRQTDTQLVVLARYMQILSDNLCRHLDGQAINIHHSFLPGFKGAKPYHQAWERGVKLIGATAHYVTSDLDEGPIIEQEVQRVDHNYSSDALVTIGRDTETVALSKAVKFHIEHRIFSHGGRTVVFR